MRATARWARLFHKRDARPKPRIPPKPILSAARDLIFEILMGMISAHGFAKGQFPPHQTLKGPRMEQQKQQVKKNENSGYLFKNANKNSEKQPDFRGKVTVNGKEFLVSGWSRTKDGEDMISISLTDPATLPPRDGAARPQQGGSSAGSFNRAPAAAPAQKPFQPQGQTTQQGGLDDDLNFDELFDETK